MAGSPRYIHLLAEAGQVAHIHLDLWNEDVESLWTTFDEQWDILENGEYDNPAELLAMSALGLALLSKITTEKIDNIVDDATALHINKNAGYAGADNPDPWANFRMATAFGATAFTGSLIRLGDKIIRTRNLRANPDNERVGEAITETIRDAIAYPLIARCLLEEEEGIAA